MFDLSFELRSEAVEFNLRDSSKEQARESIFKYPKAFALCRCELQSKNITFFMKKEFLSHFQDGDQRSILMRNRDFLPS